MLFKGTRSTIAAAALAAVLAFGAVPASAATVSLVAAPGTVHYGEEVALQPSIDTTALPGDKVNIQSFDGTQWVTWGEPLRVEETGTISPVYFVADATTPFPAQFRAVYIPAATKSADGTSAAATVSLARWAATRVVINTQPRIDRGVRPVTLNVVHDCGVGKVDVRIYRRHRLVTKFVVTTDELGFGSHLVSFAKRGTYRIKARFLGNAYGAASTLAVRTVRVR